MGRGALSINTVCVQVVEARVSPALAKVGEDREDFHEKMRLRLERCELRVNNEAGRSIYRGHRGEERFARMIRDNFFPHLTSYCLGKRCAAANSSA